MSKQLPFSLQTTEFDTIKRTALDGLVVIERKVFPDNRGFFHEIFRKDELESVLGSPFTVVQSNHAHSKPRVIRALHAEKWNKLVYPVNGEMTAFFVDIRPQSATFSKYIRIDFSDEHKYAVYIPNGIANSVCVTGSIPVDYIYLIDAYYTGQDTTAIAWDDPDLAIKWPVSDPIISERDRNNPTLRKMFPNSDI